MFKCCVCNKSSKKEKPNGEVTKQSQKAADTQIVPIDSTRVEESRPIVRDEKLNGDVQRFEEVSPRMENNCSVEVVDDLTVKSPLPSGKRDDVNDATRSRKESMVESNDKDRDDDTENPKDRMDEGKIRAANGVKDPCGNGEVDGSDSISVSGDSGGGNELMKAILNSGVPNTVKTNLYDSSAAYIERTIDDGPEDEGDDSVFEACPNDENANKKQTTVPSVPRWLSEEDDGEHDSAEECSGMQEPPATPVARDELALRRHRFFSDLLHASQNATEHRVRFDPLGPMVHAGCDGSDREDHLEELVNRLENVTERLEKVQAFSVTETQDTAVQTNTPSPRRARPVENGTSVQSASPIQSQHKSASNKIVTMSVAGYEDVLAGPVREYLQLSGKIGGDVATHSKLVEKAFQIQLEFIRTAANRPAPANPSEEVGLLAPTSTQIQQIQEFREKNRGSQFFNHLSAISESIPALGWVAVRPTPAPYVKEMNDAGQFYTNRVLKDWKEKDKIHAEWCKAWVQTLTDLQQYVRQHHTTGLVWAKTGSAPAAGIPPPPPPCMPIGDVAPVSIADDRSALFAEINQGEGITKNLKKVTSEMQTHKNPSLRTGPAPFKAPVVGNNAAVPPMKIVPPANAPIEKPPVFTKDGKKWLVEYHKGNKDLRIENVEMNNVVYMFRCQDSTLVVKGKVNSVVMDSCRKSSVVFDSLVSSIEFVNCQSVQMQVLGKVPTISIDKTDGCQMYLSADSLDVELISSKSSEMNVMVPKGNGDYAEYPVPEQFKTTVSPKGLSTIAIDSLG
ncbi:PREDICTED: adenylyl cyclase-associated protein 1 [Dufourea novaeangliae]|uniref:Adenylyl cyclase-associated protein 1 n=1 Tax=Dufourea novaeangliae TaxID=178035 RepID=A0A154P1C4_DUFNO|nr:PREDICTED: adenylyl cyclase-associated protein 1 [Dufourea novaeangliae]KZC05144.1 Adenylyl cyclase-associated protein 1 [Dufourea novaeangliae]